MTALKVVLTVILTASVVYIFWCMRGAAKYMREHPDEWRWPDSPADSKVDARKMQGSGKIDEISKPVL